jgi:hypothetical protein
MGAMQGFGDGGADFEDFSEGQGAFADAVGEGFAFEVLHDQVVGAVLRADVVELADIGMIQGGEGAGFAFEALLQFGRGGEVRGEDLDGDGAVQAGVAGAIDFTHAAGAERRFDFIGAEFCAGGESHGFGDYTLGG